MTNHHYYVICDYVLPNKFESQVKYSNLIGWARFKTFVTCRARYNCTNMGKWQNDLFCLNRFKLVWTGSNCGYVIGCVIDYVIAALGLCRFWQCTKWYSKFEEIKLIQVSSVVFRPKPKRGGWVWRHIYISATSLASVWLRHRNDVIISCFEWVMVISYRPLANSPPCFDHFAQL